MESLSRTFFNFSITPSQFCKSIQVVESYSFVLSLASLKVKAFTFLGHFLLLLPILSMEGRWNISQSSSLITWKQVSCLEYFKMDRFQSVLKYHVQYTHPLRVTVQNHVIFVWYCNIISVPASPKVGSTNHLGHCYFTILSFLIIKLPDPNSRNQSSPKAAGVHLFHSVYDGAFPQVRDLEGGQQIYPTLSPPDRPRSRWPVTHCTLTMTLTENCRAADDLKSMTPCLNYDPQPTANPQPRSEINTVS